MFDHKTDAMIYHADVLKIIDGGKTRDTIQAPADMTLTMVIMPYFQKLETGRTNRVNA